MAARNAPEEKRDYLDSLKQILIQMDSRYEGLIEAIKVEKSKLQQLINNLEREYIDLENVRANELAKLVSVKTTYETNSGGDNRVNDVQERVLKGLQVEIDNLKRMNHEKTVSLKWNYELEKEIVKLCDIKVENEPNEEKEEPEKELEKEPKPDEIETARDNIYQNIIYPKVENYAAGSDYDQLSTPAGVAICQDNSFYVADHNNNRVSAYTQWGKLKFSFQQLALLGMVNRMRGPWGVCCHGSSVYVTESRTEIQHAAVKMFDLEGKHCAEVVKFGKREGEFNDPTGLDVDGRSGELYICDRLNNRVQVFCSKLVFKGIFLDKLIYQPRDIKIGSENVYILDENDPCIHLFDKITCRIKQHLVTRGPKRDVHNPWFFALDAYRNLIISDRDTNNIKIFSQEGKLQCELGERVTLNFLRPAGIALNALGNIISVNEKPLGCLQIL